MGEMYPHRLTSTLRKCKEEETLTYKKDSLSKFCEAKFLNVGSQKKFYFP